MSVEGFGLERVLFNTLLLERQFIVNSRRILDYRRYVRRGKGSRGVPQGGMPFSGMPFTDKYTCAISQRFICASIAGRHRW